MPRALAVTVASLFLLSACGGEGSSAATSDRCEQAKSATKDAQTFATKLGKADPTYKEADLYKHLVAGKISGSEQGVAEMMQQSYQIVSDNPTCFTVPRVADSRRALKLLDSLLLGSLRQQF